MRLRSNTGAGQPVALIMTRMATALANIRPSRGIGGSAFCFCFSAELVRGEGVEGKEGDQEGRRRQRHETARYPQLCAAAAFLRRAACGGEAADGPGSRYVSAPTVWTAYFRMHMAV